ncbi:hypothetical protein H0H93_006823 [Arthromyces matolae]|nr:hypothetical protein H0H93_006823 [Arthromyces matolae]
MEVSPSSSGLEDVSPSASTGDYDKSRLSQTLSLPKEDDATGSASHVTQEVPGDASLTGSPTIVSDDFTDNVIQHESLQSDCYIQTAHDSDTPLSGGDVVASRTAPIDHCVRDHPMECISSPSGLERVEDMSPTSLQDHDRFPSARRAEDTSTESCVEDSEIPVATPLTESLMDDSDVSLHGPPQSDFPMQNGDDSDTLMSDAHDPSSIASESPSGRNVEHEALYPTTESDTNIEVTGSQSLKEGGYHAEEVQLEATHDLALMAIDDSSVLPPGCPGTDSSESSTHSNSSNVTPESLSTLSLNDHLVELIPNSCVVKGAYPTNEGSHKSICEDGYSTRPASCDTADIEPGDQPLEAALDLRERSQSLSVTNHSTAESTRNQTLEGYHISNDVPPATTDCSSVVQTRSPGSDCLGHGATGDPDTVMIDSYDPPYASLVPHTGSVDRPMEFVSSPILVEGLSSQRSALTTGRLVS